MAAKTPAQRKSGHELRKMTYEEAIIAAAAKSGQNYNVVRDKTGTMIKGNDKIKFTLGFFGHSTASGSWQLFPSASAGESEGDRYTMVHSSNGWNFSFDKSKWPVTMTSASFMEIL